MPEISNSIPGHIYEWPHQEYLDPPVDILIAFARNITARSTKRLLTAPEAGRLMAVSLAAPESVSAMMGS